VPRQVTLVGVALLTATLLTGIRWFTTDQDRLGRAAADLKRLKQLRREARRAGDRATAARLNAVQARISLMKLRAEFKPLLVVLVPLALLATWAFYRLEFHPPRPDETVELAAYLPLSAAENGSAGELVHIVPQAGLRSENGWVQMPRKVAAAPSSWDRFVAWLTRQELKRPPPEAVAVWRLQGEANVYSLVLRYRDQTLERELLIGQRAYAAAWDGRETEPYTVLRQREVRLFGLPGLATWLPAWLVGYLVLTIPLVVLLKRVFMIY
jgi:hypothetical protein